jgi:hypothetical protein
MYSRIARLAAAAGALALCTPARAVEPKPQDSGLLSLRSQLDPLQTPAAPPSASASPTAVTLRNGTLNLTINLANRSARPAGTPLWCTAVLFGASAVNFDGTDARFYFAKATVTPVSAACTVSIPYRIGVRDPNGAELTLYASVSSSVASSAILDEYYIPLVPTDRLNLLFQSMRLPLPAEGATTAMTIVGVI